MNYTVKQLAKLAGISVRTLHYYDEVGLLKPSFVKMNGYRFYEEKELIKLQQILFFRELDFSLDKIKQIMESPEFDSVAALSDQKKLLELKKKRIEGLLQTISKTITAMKGGDFMSNDDTYSAFNDPTYKKYKDEVEERWGNTDAYKQSKERVGKMSKADLDRVKAEGEAIARTTAELMVKGFSHDSAEVQKQVDLFYQHLHNFYDPSPEMFRGLGQMYVDDPRFTKVYEDRAKGFAIFMRDAMAYYADTRQNGDKK
jgi:DNA-binding transcriptional MerR regulator